MPEKTYRVADGFRPPQASTQPTNEGRARLELRTRMLPRKKRCRCQVAGHAAEQIGACIAGKAPWPLLLYGPVGSGKTCAALVVLDEAWGPVKYATINQWCQELREAQKGGPIEIRPGMAGLTETGLWNAWHAMALCVVDELGQRQASDFERQTAQRCIDMRVGDPLILCSNVGLTDLERLYDDRFTSRLSAGTIVYMGDQDRRQVGEGSQQKGKEHAR